MRKQLYQYYPKALKRSYEGYDLDKDGLILFKTYKGGVEKVVPLKKEYLVDILHNLIVRFYYKDKKEDNYFPISSVHFNEIYGYRYNYYVQYLKKEHLIRLKSDYMQGKKVRYYGIDSSVIQEEMDFFFNTDYFLLKKINKKEEETRNSKHHTSIPFHIANTLLDDLTKVTIDESGANKDLLVYCKTINTINKNRYNIACIANDYLYHKFDVFGRFHTNITTLKSEIRKQHLRINGNETCEIDIANSQPFFFVKILSENMSYFKTRAAQVEVDRFTNLVFDGKLYEHFVTTNIKRKDVKPMLYKVFFGSNTKADPENQMFVAKFPHIYQFMKDYKTTKKDYKVISHMLQRQESNFIFGKVISHIKREKPHITLTTVHDSIICEKQHKTYVNYVMDKYIRAYKAMFDYQDLQELLPYRETVQLGFD